MQQLFASLAALAVRGSASSFAGDASSMLQQVTSTECFAKESGGGPGLWVQQLLAFVTFCAFMACGPCCFSRGTRDASTKLPGKAV